MSRKGLRIADLFTVGVIGDTTGDRMTEPLGSIGVLVSLRSFIIVLGSMGGAATSFDRPLLRIDGGARRGGMRRSRDVPISRRVDAGRKFGITCWTGISAVVKGREISTTSVVGSKISDESAYRDLRSFILFSNSATLARSRFASSTREAGTTC